MQKAFIVGILIAVITPCIGVVIVLKRLSMIGDTLSHASLAGVTAGLAFGMNPIVGAIIFSVGAAFGVEKVRKSFPKYSEIALAIIMSAGVGLAGVLSGFVQNGASLNSFLFGSIVAITDFELYLVVGLSVVVILAVTLMYKELFYTTFDEESAKLAGVPIRTVGFIFTLLTAITVSVSARTVGTLVISSIAFSLLFTVSGLFVSYYADLKPGGTIALIGVAVLLLMLAFKNLFGRLFLKNAVKAEIEK